jgi:hypothetical protein
MPLCYPSSILYRCHSMNRVKVKGKSSRSDGDSKAAPNGVADATFPPQFQQQPGNIVSFIRGNKNGMPDPQAAALAMAANPQFAMMNAAAAAGFFNPAMMGFHPAAMMGMNPAMSAAFFNPEMLQAAAMQQQQMQQQQQQQMQQQQQQQPQAMSFPNNNGYNMMAMPMQANAPQAAANAPSIAVGGGAPNGGGGEATSTAEV